MSKDKKCVSIVDEGGLGNEGALAFILLWVQKGSTK
jgi:hypothetical protein